ncbi:MAG: GTPase [Bryobacterales bacterium]|jgi:GTP-binding protein Era|nr:GTPase [Bryobacterales bacterium]
MSHRSGFVSILGRPNAGKSTLLNALVGQKVSIVADKPQTTRTAIQGVMTTEESQVIFVDTPGIHKSDSTINKRMMESVRASLEERDLIIYVVDATERFGEEDRRALSMLRPNGPPVVLVFNKIDAVRAKHDLLPLMDEYSKQFDFVATLPISALKDDGLEKLRQEVISRMPEGPEYFPPDHVTDQPARFLAAELIREKILTATRQEIPHATTVIIDKWEETPAIVRMYATIYVERDGQKAIIIGAKGAMLKKIGTLAREEMESIFGIRIYLDLHVKVESRWRESAAFLNTLDWRTMAGRDDK